MEVRALLNKKWREFIHSKSPDIEDRVCDLSLCMFLASLLAGHFELELLWGEGQNNYPNLWFLIIGEPASFKSALIKRTVKPLTMTANIIENGEGDIEEDIAVANLRGSFEGFFSLLQSWDGKTILLYQDEAGPILSASEVSYKGELVKELPAFYEPHQMFVRKLRKNSFFVRDVTLNLFLAVQPVYIEEMTTKMIRTGFLPRFFPIEMPKKEDRRIVRLSTEENGVIEDRDTFKYWIEWKNSLRRELRKMELENEWWVNQKLAGLPPYLPVFWENDETALLFEQIVKKLGKDILDEDIRLWYERFVDYLPKFAFYIMIQEEILKPEWYLQTKFTIKKEHLEMAFELWYPSFEYIKQFVGKVGESAVGRYVNRLVNYLKRVEGHRISKGDAMKVLKVDADMMNKIIMTGEGRGHFRIYRYMYKGRPAMSIELDELALEEENEEGIS
jgi:hypothetical protein